MMLLVLLSSWLGRRLEKAHRLGSLALGGAVDLMGLASQ